VSVQFALDIIDRMSGPANVATRAMRSLEDELKQVDRAMKLVDKQALKLRSSLAMPGLSTQQRAALRMASQRLSVDRLQLRAAQDQVHESRRFGETARSVLGNVATWAAGATAGVAALGLSFLHAAGHMSDLRTITMNFLTTQMGAHEAADQMRRLEQFSTMYGVSLEEASTSYHRMVAQGFNTNEAMAIMQGGADVSTVMGPEVWEQLSRDLAILKQEGTVDTRHLRALSFAGVGIGDVTSEIAMARDQATEAQTGHRGTLTGHDIMEMVKNREITGEETISAALRVIQQRFSGGPNERLGTRAVNQAATTLGGSINRLDAQWHVFLSHVGDDGAFQPVMRFVNRITDALASATVEGSAFRTALKPLLDQLDQVDIAGMITRAAQALPGFIRGATDAMGLVITIVERLTQANDILHGRAVGNLGESMTEEQRGAGAGMQQAPVEQGGWVQSMFNWFDHPLQSMRMDNERLLRESDATGRDMAGRIEQGFRDRAQIHSPSKVFTRLGMNMIEGLARGMNLRLDEVENSAQAIMSTMDREIGGATVKTVGGRSVSIGDINVSVDGNNPDADEIGRQVKRHLASLITEISSSQGVAT